MIFSTVRHPFAIAQQSIVCRALQAMRVSPGHSQELEPVPAGSIISVEDLEDDSVLFTYGEHWYRCHVDELADSVQPSSPRIGTIYYGPSPAVDRPLPRVAGP